jgi:membrane-associated phospholipid phosphatase
MDFLDLIYELGQYGPIILLIYSICLLIKHETLLFYYIVGVFLNSILNIVLKGIIQQPRPSENPKLFEVAMKNGKRFIFKNGVPHDMFGMPSGHAQSCLFSSVFVFLSLQKPTQLVGYLLFSLLVMYQRVTYNYHTILQVIVGALVGSLFGYIVFSLSQEKIKGKINEKPEEYGPI